ncbi:hypothetical protein VSR01_23285 [Actinacidiphila sp. DG2A-62]|jgi:hypothetical protein|uniref:hypothetical protein n=1 Tax=Actinacidiphila sp. DG2A-62 TaxID=3108821 RepID=UPI002DB8FBBB|nr:hypothetical protein [Actinacidiphila sp. DG2A-62]MEC3996279.1 hypothetical protein [Actinacidiphila sp. DG2A-62]
MRKGLAAAGVVALITAGSAACGTDHTTPQGKVDKAFSSFGGQNTVTLGLAFDGSADQIYASMKDEDDFTRDDAKLLASLHLSLGVTTPKSFKLLGKAHTAQGGAFTLALSTDESGDTSLAEIRVVDQKLFLHADVKGLEKLAPNQNSTDIQQLNQFLDQADQLPSSLNSVKAALKGQWISLDPKAFADFAKSMGGSSGDDSGSDPLAGGLPGVPKIDAATRAKIVDALRQAFTTNVTYKDLGNHDGADHVQVTAPAKQLAKAIDDGLTPVLKDIPGYDSTALSGLQDVPNKTISADVGVKDGKLKSITFDVEQLDDQATGKLPLTLTFDGSAKAISAPPGAQVVNPQDIVGLVMSGLGKDDSDSV